MKITQSFLKDIRNYFAGQECGHLITYKWIEGKLIESSKVQKLGQYVEFLILGNLPKDGKPVTPEVQKNGNLYADWKKAYDHAHRAKATIEEMGIKFIALGRKYMKGRFEGTVDAICEATKDIVMQDGTVIKKGTRFVLDMKYSGLIEDKWNEMGWGEGGVMSEIQIMWHAIQATHYHYITGLPFFYFVIGNEGTLETDYTNIKFFQFEVSEETVKQHIADANELHERFEFEKKVGFEPRPDYIRCNKCPLKATCKDRQIYPRPLKITV